MPRIISRPTADARDESSETNLRFGPNVGKRPLPFGRSEASDLFSYTNTVNSDWYSKP
jgi:hypothetical protein